MIKLYLYNFSKRANSTKRPSGSGSAVSALLKDATSIYNPTFTIDSKEIANFNYVKWDNRYYYIDDIVHETNARESVSCSLDVLATFRTNIFNTRAYVQFATKQFDDRIVDTRLSTVDEASVKSTSAMLITDGEPSETEGGCFILEYVTSEATFGPSGCVWLNRANASALAQSLSNEGFTTWLGQNNKQISGTYQSVIGCRYVPMRWTEGQTGGDVNVKLSGYQPSGLIACGVVPVKHYSTSINIPWQFSDFRNQSPFTSMLMFLPAYGFLEINPSDLIGKTSLDVTLLVDGVTGEGVYTVGNIARAVCSFSSPVSIGTISGNNAAVLGAGVSAYTSALTGNAIGVLSGAIQGAIASQSRSVGNTGSSSGGAVARATSGSDWRNVYFYSIAHDTNQEPSSFADVQGRPLNKVITLSSLKGGYVQTVNASVSASAGNQYIEQINGLLDGGVYLE